ncbi:MAG: sigma-70 family RNA polymerase sigma factor [Actinomycetes bacterium]
MADETWLAERFETNRGRLHGVAYRMLGSPAEADDAVQEAWLRLSRSDAAEIDNLAGWLTTVVARISLDMLRSRGARREQPLDDVDRADIHDPEHDAVLADSVGAALLVVLDTLAPAERLAFVLHDMFDVPFDEIAPIVGRSQVATRKLASRARQRVQGASGEVTADAGRRREIVTAFLDASRKGEFEALLALLAPEAALVADDAAVAMGSPAEIRGARGVAEMFSGRAQAARPALIEGEPGLIWAQGGQTRVVFDFTISDGTITRIEMVAAPDEISALDIVTPSRNA